MGNNATAATCNINRAFGKNTVNERTVQLEKFHSEDFSLQKKLCGKSKASVHNNILRTLIEEDRQTTRELAKRMNVDHSTL